MPGAMKAVFHAPILEAASGGCIRGLTLFRNGLFVQTVELAVALPYSLPSDRSGLEAAGGVDTNQACGFPRQTQKRDAAGRAGTVLPAGV